MAFPKREWFTLNVPPENGKNSPLRLALLLFLSFQFLYLLTSTGRVRTMDEVTLDFEVESMANHGNTAIPQAVAQKLFFGKFDRFGRPQGPYGPGNAIAAVPWYWAGRLAVKALPGIPKASTDIVTDAFTTASNATFSALSVALAFLLFLRKGVSVRAAILAAIIIGLATPLFSYSAWFFSEPLAAALLLAATYLLFSGSPDGPIDWKEASLAGLCLGWLMWVRATHAIAIPIFLLGILLRGPKKNWKALVAAGAVVGAFGIAYLLRNEYLFQNPLDFGYPSEIEGVQRLLRFDTPLLTGIRIFLFSPGKSIFLFALPLLLAVPGIWKLYRIDRSLAVIAAGVPLVNLLFFSRYSFLEGAYSYGPRYLMPAIALLSLGLGSVLDGADLWTLRVALALFLAGFAIQGIGIATSFMENMANGAYYDANWRYRPEYAPIPGMARQLFHYAASDTPAPLGKGFDRWFVFLAKAGVSRGMIAAALALELAAFLFFAWCFWKEARQVGPISV